MPRPAARDTRRGSPPRSRTGSRGEKCGLPRATSAAPHLRGEVREIGRRPGSNVGDRRRRRRRRLRRSSAIRASIRVVTSGSAGAPSDGRELDAEVLGRIVAGREVDRAGGACAGGSRTRGRASGPAAFETSRPAKPVRGEDPRRLDGESVRQKARVVSDEDELALASVFREHARDRRDDPARVAERELLGEDGAPAGRAEADRSHASSPLAHRRSPGRLRPATAFPGAEMNLARLAPACAVAACAWRPRSRGLRRLRAAAGSREAALRLRAPDLARADRRSDTPIRPGPPIPSRPRSSHGSTRTARPSGSPPVAWDEARVARGRRVLRAAGRGEEPRPLPDGRRFRPTRGRPSPASSRMQAENSVSWITTGPRFSESIALASRSRPRRR